MLRAVKNKLKDRSGASLMVGLLFFVTCAVVGSVILAAASSSMGRISGLAETDQNRYAVQSAAKVVKDQIEQADYESVNVIGENFAEQYMNSDATRRAPISALSDVIAAMAENNLEPYWTDCEDKKTNGTIQSLWQNATSDETGQTESGASFNTTDVTLTQNPVYATTYKPSTEYLKFSVVSDDEDMGDTYDADVTIVMNSDFTMDITVSSANGDSDGGTDVHFSAKPYISMTFDSVASETDTGSPEELRQITTAMKWTVNDESGE